MRIVKGSNTTSLRLDGSSVTIRKSDNFVARQTKPDGTEFSWTFDTYPTQHGTFFDGSPWVVFPPGSSPKLIAVSPEPSEYTYEEQGLDTPNDVTIRYNGMTINPTVGTEWDTLANFAAYDGASDESGYATGRTDRKPLFADNRTNVVYSQQATASELQDVLDLYFDTTAFSTYKTALAGSGISVSDYDVIALSKSFFDAADERLYNNADDWIPRSGSDIERYSKIALERSSLIYKRTAIKYTAVLYVLTSAPASTAFRPPMCWPSALDRSQRPMFLLSDCLDVTSDAGVLGENSGSNLINEYKNTVSNFPFWQEENRNDLLNGPMHFISSYFGMGARYSGGVASWNLFPYVTDQAEYGGNKIMSQVNGLLTIMSSFETTSSGDIWFKDAERQFALHRLVQWGIDRLGELLTLSPQSGGAGQRAGLLACWPNLALYFLGEGLQSCEDIFETYYGSDWTLLTTSKKRAILRAKNYEDATIIPLFEDQTAADAAGYPTEEPEWSYALLSRTTGYLVPGYSYTGNFTMSAFTGASNERSLAYSISGTNFEYQGDVGDELGVLEWEDANPWDYNGDTESHSTTANNLLGCKLTIDGTTYTIIDYTDSLKAANATEPGQRILAVDRAFSDPADITNKSSVSISAFDAEDSGGWFWGRWATPLARPGFTARHDWMCPSLFSDGYSNIGFAALINPYSVFRAICEFESEDPANYLGVFWNWFETYTQRRAVQSDVLHRSFQLGYERQYDLGGSQNFPVWDTWNSGEEVSLGEILPFRPPA